MSISTSNVEHRISDARGMTWIVGGRMPAAVSHPASEIRNPTSRRGFSMIELLIALTISSLLLSASLVALDSTFKVYTATTDSASTHVVARLVMTRVTSMIRQGKEFGPYPPGIVIPTQVESDFIEFVSLDNADTAERQVTRLEKLEDTANPGNFVLQYSRTDYLNGFQVRQFSHPLVRNLRDARFTLEYDVGPRLTQATVDLAIVPNDSTSDGATHIHTDLVSPVLRLIASTSPRKLD
jgi:prepilin-type N-terminal cleavage/methylation domain-containing protein